MIVIPLLAHDYFRFLLELRERFEIPGVHGIVSTAQAIVGRPLKLMSYAGVARQTARRCAGDYYCWAGWGTFKYNRASTSRRLTENQWSDTALGTSAAIRPQNTWRAGVVVAVSLPFTEFGAATGKASWRRSCIPSTPARRRTTPIGRRS